MRTFAVLAIFLCSVFGLGVTLSAEANSRITIEPAFEAPSLMDEDALAKKGHKDGGRDDEESEEDLAANRPDDGRTVLEMLDVTGLDNAYKLHLATRR